MANLHAVSPRDAANPPPMIAVNPKCVETLSRDETVSLLTQCAAAQSILTAHLLTVAPDSSAPAPSTTSSEPDDTLLTVAEAAKLLRRSPRWIWRNARKLPFVRRISSRSLLCSRNEIKTWLAARAVR
jgi:hypothetical protein